MAPPRLCGYDVRSVGLDGAYFVLYLSARYFIACA